MSGWFEDKVNLVNTQNPWCIVMAFPNELTFLHMGMVDHFLSATQMSLKNGGGIDTPNEGLPWVTLE